MGRFGVALAIAGAHSVEALKGLVQLNPAAYLQLGFRHCDYQAYATPVEQGNNDFVFNVVPALNGGSGYSFQSTNFPTYYIAPAPGAGVEATRLGIVDSPDVNDASFAVVAGLSNSSLSSLQSLSLNSTFAGLYVSLSTTLSGGCSGGYGAPAGDAILADGTSDPVAATWFINQPPPPPPSVLQISGNNVTNAISEYTMGCHHDPGYVNQPQGFYSQMVYGESFEEPWNNIIAPGANVQIGLDGNTPFNGASSMRITVTAGAGYSGVSNRGLGNHGMVFQAGSVYEGSVYVQASAPVTVVLAMRDYTSGVTLGQSIFSVQPQPGVWQELAFNITPSASTTCTGIVPGSDPNITCGNMPSPAHVCVRCGGEFAVFVANLGTVNVGYVFLQPGAWGRFAGLPVQASVASTLQAMGIRAIRYGGTVAQTIQWKQWRGPAPSRPSMGHKWGQSLVSGWGPFEMIDFCNAAGIKPIVTMAMEQSVQDWTDLVEYCWGNETTTWGAVRTYNDSHPAPFNITTFELGNEEYNPNFLEQMQAMEAKAVSLGVGGSIHYMFPTNQGLSAADAAKAQQMGLPIPQIAPDIHVGGGGAVEAAESDFAALPDFPQSAINCETNAGTHHMQRALDEAADLMDWFNTQPPVIGRLLARTASFCSERSGNFDGFDQGISFFLPNMTWIQPPGYVHQIISNTWAPQALFVTLNGAPQSAVAASAQKSADGTTLTVRLVNSSPYDTMVQIVINDVTVNSQATIWSLGSAQLVADNTPAAPTAISPVQSSASVPSGSNFTLSAQTFVTLQYSIM